MNTYYQKHEEGFQELAPNRYHEQVGKEKEKQYYKSNKVRLQEQAPNKCKELSDDEKDIKREYGRNRYKNIV